MGAICTGNTARKWNKKILKLLQTLIFIRINYENLVVMRYYLLNTWCCTVIRGDLSSNTFECAIILTTNKVCRILYATNKVRLCYQSLYKALPCNATKKSFFQLTILRIIGYEPNYNKNQVILWGFIDEMNWSVIFIVHNLLLRLVISKLRRSECDL